MKNLGKTPENRLTYLLVRFTFTFHNTIDLGKHQFKLNHTSASRFSPTMDLVRDVFGVNCLLYPALAIISFLNLALVNFWLWRARIFVLPFARKEIQILLLGVTLYPPNSIFSYWKIIIRSIVWIRYYSI